MAQSYKVTLASLLLSAPIIFGQAVHSLNWVTYDNCYAEISQDERAGFSVDDFQFLEERAAQIENSHGRFWQITAPTGEISHLWGTLHSSHPSVLQLPKNVEEAIKSSDVVALETPTFLKTQAELSYVSQSDWYFDFETDRQNIEIESETEWAPPKVVKFPYTVFDEEMATWVRARIHDFGIPNLADNLSNAGLADLLTSSPCEDFSNGAMPIQDNRIAMIGMIDGAEVIGLEPYTAFETFLNNPENEQIAFAVAKTYALYLSPDFYSADYKGDAYVLYQQGRIGELMALEELDMTNYFGKEEAKKLIALTNSYLVDSRNQDFVKSLIPHLNDGNIFAAVGSFHLPGENGLVSLLRKAGYEVKRSPTLGED